jgi:protein-tyrosine kinase
MSRIHEALKKAEEERAAAQGTEAVAVPADSASAAPTSEIEAGVPAVNVPARVTVAAPATADYLRFDDLRSHCAHPEWNLIQDKNVFFHADAGGLVAEQFRTLRSRLYQLHGNGRGPLRRLLITSAIPGEGKTFVANNLAQAIVRQPDRRALLIDVDLRSSRLHMLLGAPIAPGLTDYLRGAADETAIIQHGMEGNLCFIAGGNEVKNPSELLANGRLKILLDRVAPLFDWVILDSPPCLPVADASVLAEHCDGVLLVVRAGATPAATVQRACQELKTRNVLGVVLNATDGASAYGAYSQYDYVYSRRDSNLKLVEG